MRKNALLLAALVSILSACSSGPEVKRQDYAELKNQRTFEYEFPVVWRGIEETVRKYHVTHRDPEDVDANEMRRLRHRSLETDYIYGRSTDKYVEYKVNDLPRKTYLQTRIKYDIDAQSVLGGVQVTVTTDEQIEKLKKDGSPDGWESVDHPDSSRASDLLDRINTAILSLPPSGEI